MGDGVLQIISCHVANLSWSSLPLWWAQLAKSLTSKNLNNHAPLGHHTYSCFYFNESWLLNQNILVFGCTYGLTLVRKYSNSIGNVRRSFIETNQGLRYSSKQSHTSFLNLVENLK